MSDTENAGLAPAMQREALAKPVDVVIGTPQKIAQHAQAGNLYYGDVQVREQRALLYETVGQLGRHASDGGGPTTHTLMHRCSASFCSL